MDLSTKFSGTQVARKGKALLFVAVILTLSFTASAQNVSPVIADISKPGTEDADLQFIATDFTDKFTDIDNNPLDKIQVINLPANGTLKLNTTDITVDQEILAADLASITFTPNADWNGNTTFNWNGYDGTVYATSNAAVNINIAASNDPPVVADISKSGTEDINLTFVANDFTSKFTDIDGNTLAKIQVINLPANGTLKLNTTNITVGQEILATDLANITFTPNANWNGSTSFDWNGYDGTSYAAVTAKVNITTEAVNDMPTFIKGADQTVNEDAGIQTVNNWATALAQGPADESAQTLSFTVTNNNNSLFSAQPAINTSGGLTYTPTANASGLATVSVVLKDDGGIANGGIDTYTTQTFTITVNPVNDMPTFIKGADQTVNEDAGIQTVNNWATALAKGPADESTQTLSFTVTNNNNSLFSAQPAINTSGSLTYTPTANASGLATVSVVLKDDGGIANGGIDTYTTQTFTITLNPVNDMPTFIKGADQTVNEDAGIQTVNNWATALAKGPADESAQTLSFTVTNNNNSLFSAQPAINTSGGLTYTPTANASGLATVSVVLKDDGGIANGGIDTYTTQTFTITVNPVNDMPTFIKGADQTVNEDAGIQTVNNWATALAKGPADESAQTLSFTVTNNNNSLFSAQPAINTSGGLTYTPTANASGLATVSVVLKDDGGIANGGIDTYTTQTFTITVNPVNDMPTFIKGADQTVNEDAGIQTVNNWATALAKGPADESTQTLSFTVTNNNNSLFSAQPAINTSGSLTYTPTANASGLATVSVVLKDDGGIANGGIDTYTTQTFTITVNPVNDMPTFIKGADQTVNEDAGIQTVNNWVTALVKGPADESAQALSFTVTNNNNSLFSAQPAINTSGSLTYTPTANASGLATVSVVLKDDGGIANGGIDTYTTQTFTITVNPVNDMPTFIKGADQTVNEDAGIQTVNNWATALVKGPADESAQTLSFTVTNNNNSLFSAQPAINTSGNLTYTPTANASGLATVSVVLKDDGGIANGGIDTYTTQTFTITVNPVNDPPVAVNDATSTNEDTPVTLNVTTNDTDIDGTINVATVDLNTGSAGIQNTFTVAGQGTYTVDNLGVVTFNPAPNYNGTATPVNYTVNDNSGAVSNIATISITVNPVNDIPVAVNDNPTMNRDAILNGNVSSNDTPSGDGGNIWTKTTNPAHGSLTFNTTGTYIYTPVANYSGTDNFTYTITDVDGSTSTATVNISIAQIIGAAPLANNDNINVNEDEIVNENAATNDIPSADGGNVWAIVTNPLHGTATMNPVGTYTYSPNLNFNGNDSFTYSITDINADKSVATINITVIPVNDPPVATPETITTPEDTPINGTVKATDVDGNVLTYSKTTNSTHGSTTVNPDGTYTYAATANYNGSDSFTVTVNDGNGGTTTVTINIIVTPVNDAPVLNDPTNPTFDPATKSYNITIPEDTPINGAVKATDVDGNTLTYSKTTDSTHGTATVNADGTYTYTPTANYNGNDSFTVTVNDGNGGTTTATINIIVTSVNDVPVPNDPTNPTFDPATKSYNITTPEDTPINGAVKATDVDGNTLIYSKTTDSTHGTTTVNADGTYTYTPTANYNGNDSFTVTVNDGNGGTTTATVNITITPVNDTPVAVNDNPIMNRDAVLNGDVSTNDIPSGDGGNIWTKATNPSHGTVVFNTNGTYTYTPVANYSGSDSFAYTITDTDGNMSSAIVYISISQIIGAAPLANNDNTTVNEDEIINGNAASNDIPSSDGGNVWVIVTNPLHGTATMDLVGTYTYSPNPNYNGNDSFTYSITDINSDKSIATINIIVTPVNDPPMATASPATTMENKPVNGTVTATDIDSDPLTFTKTTDPSHGTVTVSADGTYTYTPTTNFNGNDSFTVTANDGKGGKGTVTVNVTVAPPNNPPVINDPTNPAYNPLTGSYTVITPVNSLISGKVNATDINNDPLSYSKDADPTNGTATVNTDGTYIYTPNANYTGHDSFRVKVNDGKGGTTTVIVNITTVALPKITMKASKPVLSGNDTFSWTYTITINNGTNQKIDSVRIIDNLDNAFRDKGITYEITSITASGNLWANGLFNGSGKIETLISDSSYITSNNKDSILIEMKVNPHSYVGDVHNQAHLNGYIANIKYHFTNILSDDLNLGGSTDSTVTSIPQIDLFVPNAFSPNGDTKNQTFVITHSGSVKLEFEVFNRWGNSVYKNSDYQNDWNGKGTGNFLGQDIPSGTYYCIYKAINTSTGAIENKGMKYITLRR